jgi:hypothetical protein
MEDTTMPQVTFDISKKTLNYLNNHHVTLDEAMDFAAAGIRWETPNEETERVLMRSDDDPAMYTAKSKEEFFKHLGLDKYLDKHVW